MIIDTDEIISKVKGFFSPSKPVEEVKQAQYESAADAMCAALTALNSTYNVETNEESQDKVIYFKYQGMNFRAFTSAEEGKNDCNIDFHAGIYKAHDLENIRRVCNKANSAVSPIHFYYVPDTQNNNYNLYETVTLTNVVELPNLQELVSKTLENIFHSQHNFAQAFKKAKEDKVADEDELFMDQHEIWMAREMEANLQQRHSLLHSCEASTLLLTDFLENIYGIQSVEIEYLDICANGQSKHITDTERIHSYLLLEPVVSVNANEGKVDVKEQTATVSVFYVLPKGNMRNVMLSLTVENDESNAVYVRVTALRQGDCIAFDNLWGSSRNLPKAVSMLLAVDRSTEAKKRAEVKYMWDEALKKKETGEKLSDDEEYLVRLSSIPQLGDSAYLGRKLFNRKRFAEALKYFENVHEYLEENFFEDFWNDSLREYFSRNCFFISFCYCELGDSTRGVYFAEKACLIYPCPLHTMNYIKAMFKANDFRLFHEIRARMEEIEAIESNLKEDETLNETQVEMYDFLQQSLILSLIRFRKWEEAKGRLTQILKQGPDYLQEWAKQKLDGIKDKK